MGKGLIDLFRARVDKNMKLAFVFTFVMGLLIHMYKFTNYLMCLDTLTSIYSDQNIISTGRWFLSAACGLSSYFDLPWLIGLLSLLYISLTAVVVTDMFRLTDPVAIMLTCGLIVSFPAITETFYYEYTADGYFLAMLLATVSARLTLIGENRKGRVIAAIILICLSCGIYQVYVCFSLMLLIAHLLLSLLENRHSRAQYLRWFRNQAIIYIAGLALYLVLWKVLMAAQGESAESYQGMDGIGGFSVSYLGRAAYLVIYDFLMFFFNVKNTLAYGPNAITVFNVVFVLLFIAACVTAVKRSGLYKRRLRLLLFVAALAATPFVVFMWLFAAEGAYYGLRMELSLCVYYILLVIFAEKWFKQRSKDIVAVVLALGVFLFSLSANICYFYLNICFEASRAMAIELSTRIHMIDDGTCDTVVICGDQPDVTDTSLLYQEKVLKSVGTYNQYYLNNLLRGPRQTAIFLQDITGFKLSFVNERPDGSETVLTTDYFGDIQDDEYEYIRRSEEYRNMPCWPAEQSVKRFGSVIVVKYSETSEAAGGSLNDRVSFTDVVSFTDIGLLNADGTVEPDE